MDKFEFGKIPELAPPPNACWCALHAVHDLQFVQILLD
jgi:hypothetical protein